MKAATKTSILCACVSIAFNTSTANAAKWICEDGTFDRSTIDNYKCEKEAMRFEKLLRIQILRNCKAELTSPENCLKSKANKLGDFTDTGVGAK